MNASLFVELRKMLLNLLKEFNPFSGKYVKMPRLDPDLVTHKLNFNEGRRPTKQASRNIRPELEVQIKYKI